MLPLLILLFTLMPILEISVLLQVGQVLGGWNTIIVVIVTAVIGATLVRSQGLQTMFRVRHRMAMGEMPGQEMIEGFLLVVAGVLLVTPGFITDIVGLLLAAPLTRKRIADKMMRHMVVHTVHMDPTTHHVDPTRSPFERHHQPPQNRSKSRSGNVYEGEYISKDDK